MTAATRGLTNLFELYDEHHSGYLTADQLHKMYEGIRVGGISFTQIIASLDFVNGNTDYITLGELRSVLNEIDRRYFLIQDLQWEFALLDNQHHGVISVEKARFLFEVVHGKFFSATNWNRFLRRRVLPDALLSFADMEVDLCNPPPLGDFDADHLNGEPKLNKEEERRRKKKQYKNSERETRRAKSFSTNQNRIDDKDAEETERSLHLPTKEGGRGKKKHDADMKETDERETEKKEKRREKEERKKKEKTAKRRAEHQVLYDQLESAVESRDPGVLEPAINQYKTGVPQSREQDELLSKAERLLAMLKCSSELHDAMTKRVIAELESAIDKAKKSGFNQSELADQVTEADDLLLRLKRLEKLRNEVLELKQSTIAELRSYQNPMPVIHKVMTATYLLLGTPVKQTKDWHNIQALLGKTGREGLKRRIGQCDVLKVTLPTAKRARDLMGEVDLESMRDVSAGAATFFVWTDGIIEEVESNSKNIKSNQ